MEKHLDFLPGVIFTDNKEYYLTISVITEITLPEFKEYSLFYKHESMIDANAPSDIKWFTSNPSLLEATKHLYEKLHRDGFIKKSILDNSILTRNVLSLN